MRTFSHLTQYLVCRVPHKELKHMQRYEIDVAGVKLHQDKPEGNVAHILT